MRIQSERAANYSMVTCGGQSSAPLLYAISRNVKKVLDVEISSSIASKSAGPATRRNINNYIYTTQSLAQQITDCSRAKAILVLNPAEPPVLMRTTVQALCEGISIEEVDNTLKKL